MLTKSVEFITGTAGNDTFRGTIDGATSTESTLNALDEINGGAGIDTLKITTSGTGNIALPTLSNV